MLQSRRVMLHAAPRGGRGVQRWSFLTFSAGLSSEDSALGSGGWKLCGLTPSRSCTAVVARRLSEDHWWRRDVTDLRPGTGVLSLGCSVLRSSCFSRRMHTNLSMNLSVSLFVCVFTCMCTHSVCKSAYTVHVGVLSTCPLVIACLCSSPARQVRIRFHWLSTPMVPVHIVSFPCPFLFPSSLVLAGAAKFLSVKRALACMQRLRRPFLSRCQRPICPSTKTIVDKEDWCQDPSGKLWAFSDASSAQKLRLEMKTMASVAEARWWHS